MRRAFRVAYDGTRFRGFQRQPHGETVSDAILDALATLEVLAGGETTPPGYAAAGRTDAGVSALAQTVAFDCPEWLTPAALNAELSVDVRAWAIAEASESFHATHDATARAYVYHCHAPDADAGRAHEAMAALAGRHDFHNLTTDTEGTERDLETALECDGNYLRLHFRAGGFPRQFVRRAVTLVSNVAEGAPFERIERALAPEPLSGPEGIASAPPEPLVLTAVDYPEIEFQRDRAAVDDARAVFAEKRVDHRTRARVAGDIASGF